MVNYSIKYPESVQRAEFNYYDIVNLNSEINNVFAPILYINFLFILLLSSSWSLYLVRRLMKDYRKEKLKSKLRMSMDRNVWENSMNNFKSNRIKNSFLLVVCLSEVGATISLICRIVYIFDQSISEIHSIQEAVTIKESYELACEIADYLSLELDHTYRIYNTITVLSVYSTALFLRILTQYMIYQYSYYKLHLNFKTELIVPLYVILLLFIMGIISQLIMIFYICVVLVIIRELILLFIGNKKLCLLLKQRLNDAILHENQPGYVILYYRLAYREYKYSSRIFLVAFSLQIIGLSLYCIQPLVMAIVLDSTHYVSFDREDYFDLQAFYLSLGMYDLIVNSIEVVLLTLGTSLQIILYLIVSLRRLTRNVYNKIRQTGKFSSTSPSIRILIERNQSAYLQKN